MTIRLIPQCSVSECERDVHSSGMCSIHYKRMLRNGTTNATRASPSNRVGNFECPACHETTTSVKDSRPTEEGYVKRRRVCDNCRTRVTTLEVPIELFRAIQIHTQLAAIRDPLNTIVENFNSIYKAVRLGQKLEETL